MIIQGFKKQVANEFERAEVYYTMLSVINSFNLTKGEIRLIAFTAIKGNITNGNVREEFCRLYKTTDSVIGNIISKLKKFDIFVKENSKTKVNKSIALDFSKDVQLTISLILDKE